MQPKRSSPGRVAATAFAAVFIVGVCAMSVLTLSPSAGTEQTMELISSGICYVGPVVALIAYFWARNQA